MQRDLTQSSGDDRWAELREQWLMEKFNLSHSERTIEAYSEVSSRFRLALHAEGLELDSDPRAIARVMRRYLAQGKEKLVEPGTYNQRRSILSSYFRFLMTQGAVDRNPTDFVTIMRGKKEEREPAITEAGWKAALRAIDRNTKTGLRDYALIMLAGMTGKRSKELLSLNVGHVQPRENGVVISWVHTKAGQDHERFYPDAYAASLIAWLAHYYGQGWRSLPASTPVFVNLSRNGNGKRITHDGMALVFKRRLGTTKIHSSRHLFAEMMLDAGLNIFEIQAMMGHSSITTTQRYIKSKFKHVGDLTNRLADHVGQLDIGEQE